MNTFFLAQPSARRKYLIALPKTGSLHRMRPIGEDGSLHSK